MATYLFKNKKYFIGLLLGLFFLPLFSSAQFITTNAPCEPEIIPPLGQVAGVYCPYCTNKGEYLHLKWDLKTNFQDPVCGIECWGPSGDQCYNWSSAEQWFDENGRSKTKLKPKDDVFIKGPPVSTRSAVPGTNLQVHCWEKNDASDPSKKKTSAGIRVYSDNACGEPAVGEPCEIPFQEIENKMLSFKPFIITEKDFKGWSDGDALDGGLSGSGNKDTIFNFMGETQCELIDEFDLVSTPTNTTLRPTAIRRYFSKYDKNRQAVPFSLIIPKTVTLADGTQTTSFYGHAAIFLGYRSNILDQDKIASGYIAFEWLDSNGPSYQTTICRPVSVGLPYRIFVGSSHYLCSDIIGNYEDYIIKVPSDAPGVIPMHGDFLAKLEKNAIRNNTADWLLNSTNWPDVPNAGFNGSQGICSGWVNFVLKVAYLGNFSGEDYHPGDGKIVGRDCGIDRYPIAKSVSRNSSLLSNIFSILSKYILD